MLKKKIKILAIETSCDETSAAILIGSANKKYIKNATPKIINNIVYSQLDLHRKTKGIVPEVASRAHIEKILFVIEKAFKSAKIGIAQVDIVAVTVGPGLIGSLLVGVDTAKSLSFILKKPVIPINHIEAHIYANFVNKTPKFPAVALIVSGGHTSIILIKDYDNYKLLGSTIDDAAGEAFDKVAKILSLPYPGGPAIAAAAEKSNSKSQICLPRPMIDSDNFDFSFSGIKTSVLYLVKRLGPKNANKMRNQIAAEFQQAVIDVLVFKTVKAARKYQAKSIIIGGGVAANKLLRRELKQRVKIKLPNLELMIPDPSLCTDNAAIIGICGYYKYLANNKNLINYSKIRINLDSDL